MKSIMLRYIHLLVLVLLIGLAAWLRLYRLDSVTALNADEAALGYNAWSLWLTGKDEFGHPWPLVFQSFNDYKPGVYVYLALPFVGIMGLSSWAVRMPGILMSLATVAMMYPLTLELVGTKFRWRRLTGLLAVLVLAVMPWHIHFSRGGWETQVATGFLVIGTYALLRGLGSFRWRLVGVLLYVLAIYTYHSMRVVVPLMGMLYVVLYWKFHVAHLRQSLALIFLGLVCLIPLGLQLTGESGLSRAAGVSIWADSGPVWRVNEIRSLHGVPTPVWVKLLNNKMTAYGQEFLGNYALHFGPRYLFFDGDEIQRNRVPEFGQLLVVMLPFYVVGLVVLFGKEVKHWWILFGWLLIAPIPAALTFQSPHAVRSFSMTIPLAVIAALGIRQVVLWSFDMRRGLGYAISVLIFMLLFWDLQRYLFNYYRLLQAWYPQATQYGFAQLVPWMEANKANYDRIYVTTAYDQPYILSLFYSEYPPERFQAEAMLTPRDEFGYSTVAAYDMYRFRPLTIDAIPVAEGERVMVVGTPEEIGEGNEIVHSISVGSYTYFYIITLEE